MNNESIDIDRQRKDVYGTEYEKHILEQYKLYVEMADRISARRMLANSFFISVHMAIITAFAILFKERILVFSFIGCAPFIAVFLLCIVWWRMVKSYRQLNSIKFKVIIAIESRLPIAPFNAEWTALECGKNPKRYRRLTNVETWIPFCFLLLYILLGIAVWCQS